MNHRVIYHIEYSKNWNIAWSWGEICMLENIKYFISKWEKNVILTTENWKKAFESWGLKESNLLEYKIIKTDDPRTHFKLLLNYIKRVFLAKKQIKELLINDNDILICHSDFFPNSIPLYFLSKNNKRAQFFYYFHTKYPSIFKWFEWEFIWKYTFPKVNMIYLKLSQILYLIIIKKINRWFVLVVNPCFKNYICDFLRKTNVKAHFFKIFWWVKEKVIFNDKKIYDLVWLWRFQKLKWIYEIFEIISLLKKEKSDIKIAVIWWWGDEVEKDFINKINESNLQDNIFYKWFINWAEKFKILSQSNIFLMTSYFEWRPITIIEAMKIWLPVVAYDLPVYWIYDKWIIKVPILNNNDMSFQILKLLNDKHLLSEKSIEALDFSKNYSWENTWEEIYNLFK